MNRIEKTDKSKKFQIVGLGEILFDILPDKTKSLGGAPANFAYVSSALGNVGIIVSRVGSDENGQGILSILRENHLTTDQIQIDEQNLTGTVEVELKNGQAEYIFQEKSAWDHLVFDQKLKNLAENCDAVCFGTLAQRNEDSRRTIIKFLQNTKPNCKRIFDINLRENYYSKELIEHSLKFTDILKLSDSELEIFIQFFDFQGKSDLEILRSILVKFELEMVCLTKGGSGSLLVNETSFSEHKGLKIKIADTIGAGDAFTAALTFGILEKFDLDKINDLANRVGAFVASQKGAMPDFENFNDL